MHSEKIDVPSQVQAAQADPARIGDLIDRFAAITEPGPGVTRLAFTPLERKAHDVFRAHMENLELAVSTDAVGNTIATLPPTESFDELLPAIGTGSHLDSVPGGGRFDGIAGVVAAMEVATLVATDDQPRRRPWRFVAFAGEEGARFGQACTGSRVVAGLTSSAALSELADGEGTTLADALRDLGFDPAEADTAAWNPADWDSFVELHIEQGDVLERRGLPVGVVETISGSTRMRVRVTGRASHTGGTPMFSRRDPLVTASRCVLQGDSLAKDEEHHGTRVTVGDFHVLPNSITTIPGEVIFTVDIRDTDSVRQRAVAEKLALLYRECAALDGTTAHIDRIGDTSPVYLPRETVDEIAAAAAEVGAGSLLMTSGASHDAQQISHIIPTGMIFVPSEGGLSHVPGEYTSSAQIAVGTDVLLSTLRRLDAHA